MSHNVIISHEPFSRVTMISIDGVDQKQVTSYSLSQQSDGKPPRFKISQHVGTIDTNSNTWEEVTREFTPRSITYKTV